VSANETEIVLEYSDFGAIGREQARQIDKVCRDTAFTIEAKAKAAIMNPPKTGRYYKHGNVVHQASAPGEAPATDTGNLVGSGYTKKMGDSDYETGFGNTAETAEYAAPLEFGTPRILPRPYLRPAVEAVRDQFVSAIRQIVEK